MHTGSGHGDVFGMQEVSGRRSIMGGSDSGSEYAGMPLTCLVGRAGPAKRSFGTSAVQVLVPES